jgi:hypothetical protein
MIVRGHLPVIKPPKIDKKSSILLVRPPSYSEKIHKEDSELEESEDKNKDFVKNYGNDSDEEEDDKYGKGYHRRQSSDEERMREQQQQQQQYQSGTFAFACRFT